MVLSRGFYGDNSLDTSLDKITNTGDNPCTNISIGQLKDSQEQKSLNKFLYEPLREWRKESLEKFVERTSNESLNVSL